jgi:hypothetical protein
MGLCECRVLRAMRASGFGGGFCLLVVACVFLCVLPPLDATLSFWGRWGSLSCFSSLLCVVTCSAMFGV